MTASDKLPVDEFARELAEEGNRVRNFVASNRSDTLLRIFDFLLEQSIAGLRPKEPEIAEAVFRDWQTAPDQKGSRVRVGVYRLRKKLDLFYAGSKGTRLTIPQGEYAFVLETPECLKDAREATGKGKPAHRRRAYLMWGVLLLLLTVNAIFAREYLDRAPSGRGPLARSALWAPFLRGSTSTFIVMGDYFMFSSKPKKSADETIIQDLSIQSADAFYDYLMQHPGMRETLRNEDLYAISADMLAPVGHLSAYLRSVPLKPATSSQLDADMMKSSNVVYVGALDALSPWLSGPLFRASGFRCDDRCYEITDQRSGRRFVSDSPYTLEDRIVPRRDYGYIASLPGPSGHQILIVSGTGDAAVRQMASVVADPKMVEQLRTRLDGDLSSFEAMYQVRTMFDQSYGSTLLIARPLRTGGIWDRSRPER